MNVFKYDVVEISDPRIEDGKIKFGVKLDDRHFHKEVVIPSFIDEDTFLFFYQTIIGVAAYSYALVSKRVVLHFGFYSQQEDFLERIKFGYYSNMRIFLGHLLMSSDSIGIVEKGECLGSYSDALHHTKPNTATLLYSGGKESLLSSIILEEAGIKTDKLFINSGLLEGDISDINALKGCDVVDISKAFLLFEDEVITDGTWDNPFFAMERDLIATAYAMSKGSSYICIGNEFECTGLTFDGFGGSLNYGRSYQQSNFFLKELQRLTYNLGFNVNVFSPVQNMSPLFEEAAFAFVYRDRLDDQFSCERNMEIDQEGNFSPCCSCIKCLTMNAFLVGFNKILERNGKEKIQSKYIVDEDVTTIPCTPVHFGEHYIDDNQLEQIENLLIGKFQLDYFLLTFDEIHREDFLPPKVLRIVKLIETKLKKEIETWN